MEVGLGKRETPITLLQGGKNESSGSIYCSNQFRIYLSYSNIQFRIYIDKRFCDAVIEVRFIIVTDVRQYVYIIRDSKPVTSIDFISITTSKEYYNCYNTDYIYII